MTLAIQGTLPNSVYTQLNEGKVTKQTAFQRVKNILTTGHLFENWQTQACRGLFIANTCALILSIFQFSLLWAGFHAGALVVSSILAKEFDDYTNLHKATASYREQNMEFALSNLDLRNNINMISAERKRFGEENAKYRALNEDHGYNNTVYGGLNDRLAGTIDDLDDLGGQLHEIITSGGEINVQTLDKCIELMDRIKEEKQLVEGFTETLREDHQKHYTQLKRTLDQAERTGNHQIQMTQEMSDELEKYQGQAQALRDEIAYLEKVRNSLLEGTKDFRGEIAYLKKVRDDIHESADYLRQATNQNIESSNMVSGAMKSLFYSQGQSGQPEFSFDKIAGIAIVGLVARHVLYN